MAKWSAADDPTIYIIRATESSPNTNANKGLPLTTDSQIISSECAEGALVEISQSLHRHINTSHTNKRCICICIVSSHYILAATIASVASGVQSWKSSNDKIRLGFTIAARIWAMRRRDLKATMISVAHACASMFPNQMFRSCLIFVFFFFRRWLCNNVLLLVQLSGTQFALWPQILKKCYWRMLSSSNFFRRQVSSSP